MNQGISTMKEADTVAEEIERCMTTETKTEHAENESKTWTKLFKKWAVHLDRKAQTSDWKEGPMEMTETTSRAITVRAKNKSRRRKKKAKKDNRIKCDYEKSCSTLYKKIEAKDWDAVVFFLETGCWPNSDIADKMNPKQQAMTWVTRYDPRDNTRIRWSELPLHLAIVFGAPFPVIRLLIDMHPKSVRIADDQRMLPIHMALHWNAPDDTVAYLFSKFPQSVNAKGEGNRKLLNIFLTRVKASDHQGNSFGDADDEIEVLNSLLDAKSRAAENALSKFSKICAARAEDESEFLAKLDALQQSKEEAEKRASEEIANLKDQKLVEEIAFQMMIDDTDRAKEQAKQAEQHAREEETAIRREFESLSNAIETASSRGDLNKIKLEIKSTKVSRFRRNKQALKMRIEAMHSDLERSKIALGDKRDSELKEMMKTVEKLGKEVKMARTDDDVIDLRSKADNLKSAIKERYEACKTMMELTALRIVLKADLQTNASQEKLGRFQKALDAMQGFEKLSSRELAALKREIMSVRKESKRKELVIKTQRDLDELKDALEDKLNVADDASSHVIVKTMSAVDEIETDLASKKSAEQLLELSKKIDVLKEEIKAEEFASNLRHEIQALKKDIKDEARKSKGKTRQEVAKLKKTVKSVKDLEEKTTGELMVDKAQLEAIKPVQKKSAMEQTQKRMATARKKLDQNKKHRPMPKKDQNGHDPYVDNIDVTTLEIQDSAEQAELVAKATQVKQDLNRLKHTLKCALEASNDRGATEELRALKNSVDSFPVDLDTKDTFQFKHIEDELTALKDDLMTKEAGRALLKKEQEMFRSQRSPGGWGNLDSTFSTVFGKLSNPINSLSQIACAPDGNLDLLTEPSSASLEMSSSWSSFNSTVSETMDTNHQHMPKRPSYSLEESLTDPDSLVS